MYNLVIACTVIVLLLGSCSGPVKENSENKNGDSMTVETLNQKAFKSRNRQPDSSLYYGRQAQALAQVKSLQFATSTAWNVMGLAHKNLGNYDSAMYCYAKSYSIRENLNRPADAARVQVNIGKVYDLKSDFVRALQSYTQALEIFERQNSRSDRALALENIAVLYEKHGDFSLAMKYYRDSQIAYEKLDDDEGRSRIFNNMGSLYMQTDSLHVALDNFSNSVVLKLNSGDNRGLANSYNNMGDVFARMSQPQEAEKVYLKALEINTGINNPLGMGNSTFKLGLLYNNQRKYERALDHYKKAAALFSDIGASNELRSVYENMAMASNSMGHFKIAYEYLQQYDSMNSIVFNETKNRQVEEIKRKYETEKKEKELSLKQHQLAEASMKNRNMVTVLLATVLVTSLAVILIAQRMRMRRIVEKKNERIHNQKIDQLLSEQELKLLEAMIEGQEKEKRRMALDLHDQLGSTLSAAKLHLEALDLGTSRAAQLLDQAIDDTREIAHNLTSGLLVKFGLLPALNELRESIQSTHKINMKVATKQFDGRLPSLDQEVGLYRIAQEAINNALRHAQAEEIIVRIEVEDHTLTLSVQDNGKGFDVHDLSDGMGRKNIRARAAKINALAEIRSSLGNGTEVEVKLKL